MMFDNLQNKIVGICGFRRHGRKIYDMLLCSGVKVAYIIERNYEALEVTCSDIATPIVGFNRERDLYSEANLIVVSADISDAVFFECYMLSDIDVEYCFVDDNCEVLEKKSINTHKSKIEHFYDFHGIKAEVLEKWEKRGVKSFNDCVSDKYKCEYKFDKLLQCENDIWLEHEFPDVYRLNRIGKYVDALKCICECVEIPYTSKGFIHFIDHRFLFDTTRGYRFENITADYSDFLTHGFNELKYPDDGTINKFCADYNHTLDALIVLSNRVANLYGTRFSELDSDGTVLSEEERIHCESVMNCFKNMIDKPADRFADALQRILFIDQLLWQTGHRLMGLGHLDDILWQFYENDIQKNRLTRENAIELICNFYNALHRYCWLKSNLLLGDTGQIIILGNRNEDGTCKYNELTTLFLEAVGRVHLPDPKLLLRVGGDTPHSIIENALRCMMHGTGSPILANDDVIIPRLTAFGVPKNDAVQYGVAACWEPLIPGKSISPNNMKYISYPLVLRNALYQADEDSIKTFDVLMKLFLDKVDDEIKRLMNILSDFRFQYDPLLSLCVKSCNEKKLDVSAGGADYFSCGFTTVGLSNTVNALLNIKEYVFDKAEISISEACRMLEANFNGYEEWQVKLKERSPRYGMDNKYVIEISNIIMRETSNRIDAYKNYMGGRFKIGISAPSYIDASKDEPASFDGRKRGEPFGVHISSDSGDGYTGIMNFASMLDYNDNRFNGNVTDIMVSPSFLDKNFEKMVMLLKAAISKGFFEFQMNVVGSKELIEAKKHPEKYPDLIVRVWGFSALFVELPESYQDVLIYRALENERKNAV